MGWIEPIGAAITALEISKYVVEQSSTIRRYAARIKYWIQNGSAIVPIFGSGGVGKSTLSQLLTGFDPLDMATPYAESPSIEEVKLTGNIPGRLLVAPGQAARIDRYWPNLYKTVVGNESFGLINVVSYGYHSIAIQSFREHDDYSEGMNEDDFLRRYQEVRLGVEIEMLEKVIHGLSAATPRSLWMLTVINKQDLWWSERDKVREYYEAGPYGSMIQDLTNSIGKRVFQHEFIPVSMALGNFTTVAGEVLAKTTAGYDMPTHLRYLDSMFSQIGELLRRGAA